MANRSVEFGKFLKRYRTGIHPDRRSLGAVVRLPSRVGKAVTQEEVAEAVGISREYYVRIEAGYRLRVSPALLTRLADVLMLDPAERAEVFQLAIPELRSSIALQPTTLEVLEAIRLARRVARSVWTATTEVEALEMLAEAVDEQFPDADIVGGYMRSQPGQWQFPVAIGNERLQQRVGRLCADLFDGLNPQQIDEVMLNVALTEPGQVGTRRELHPNLALAHLVSKTWERAGLRDGDFITAHIRSSGGFEANLFVASLRRPRDFSEVERAILSSVTDLASVALSSHSGRALEK